MSSNSGNRMRHSLACLPAYPELQPTNLPIGRLHQALQATTTLSSMSSSSIQFSDPNSPSLQFPLEPPRNDRELALSHQNDYLPTPLNRRSPERSRFRCATPRWNAICLLGNKRIRSAYAKRKTNNNDCTRECNCKKTEARKILVNLNNRQHLPITETHIRL